MTPAPAETRRNYRAIIQAAWDRTRGQPETARYLAIGEQSTATTTRDRQVWIEELRQVTQAAAETEPPQGKTA